MELLELMKYRRSIRRYSDKQIPKEDLQKILEAGAYAPNAGGGQRSIIVAVHNQELTEKIGILNLAKFDRSNLLGSYVSKEQPSIIDDKSIKNGFYNAPTVCIIFTPRNFLYGVPDAFCCAENMVLEATNLKISSCMVARAEETFDNDFGRELLKKWDIPDEFIARCFVLLGYCDGEYPKNKPRKIERIKIIEE
ncbi:MAG: nitroreductase family protein [Oscillospiraceae bacterium]|nr:nitroreductase family protein [Oscillospiraceae bacterium]